MQTAWPQTYGNEEIWTLTHLDGDIEGHYGLGLQETSVSRNVGHVQVFKEHMSELEHEIIKHDINKLSQYTLMTIITSLR